MAGTIPNPAQIQQGASGQAVKNAQGLLLAHGNDPKGIDGSFGANTKGATQAPSSATIPWGHGSLSGPAAR